MPWREHTTDPASLRGANGIYSFLFSTRCARLSKQMPIHNSCYVSLRIGPSRERDVQSRKNREFWLLNKIAYAGDGRRIGLVRNHLASPRESNCKAPIKTTPYGNTGNNKQLSPLLPDGNSFFRCCCNIFPPQCICNYGSGALTQFVFKLPLSQLDFRGR